MPRAPFSISRLSPAPPSEGPSLTLADHLEELRRRLGLSLLALLIGVGVALSQVARIIRWLQWPAVGLVPRFAYFTPTEPLTAYLKVGVLAGLILAMPVILAQLWGFIRPGLTPKEQAYGGGFIWWGSVSFIAGAVFAYYALLPASLTMLLGIGRETLLPMLSIDAYLGFVTTLLFWCGLVFELPAILFVLAQVGVVTSEWLRQQRPYAILVLVTLAAIMTPTTDAISLLLLAVPLVVLYETSIMVTRLALRRPASACTPTPTARPTPPAR